MSVRTVIIPAMMGLLWALPCSAQTNLVLYLDASNPGPNPATGWQDLSGSGNNFTNMGAQYSALQQAFLFGGPSAAANPGDPDDGPHDAYLELINTGTGFDDDFDFETDAVALAGNGNPFSIVAWLNAGQDPGDDFDAILVQKGPTFDNEWHVAPQGAPSHNTEIVFNEGAQNNRMFGRQPGTPTGFHLLVVTHNGSGFVGGPEETRFYFNDTEVTANMIAINDGFDLNAPIESDAPVRVGAGAFNQDPRSYFEGAVGFIEIWQGVLDPAYATFRYNGGNPMRAPGPPPVTLPVTPTPVAATRLCFESAINGIYELQYTGDLLTTNPWTMATGYLLTGQGTNTYVFDPEPVPAGTTQRFYRVWDDN